MNDSHIITSPLPRCLQVQNQAIRVFYDPFTHLVNDCSTFKLPVRVPVSEGKPCVLLFVSSFCLRKKSVGQCLSACCVPVQPVLMAARVGMGGWEESAIFPSEHFSFDIFPSGPSIPF